MRGLFRPRVILAFFLKDLWITISYRLPFALNFFAILFTLTLVFFVSRFVNLSSIPLGGHSKSVDYFSYIVIGVAAMDYLTMALRSFSMQFRSEQLTGTLEALMASPAPLSSILAGMVSWNFAMTGIYVLVYIVLAALLFHMQVAWSGLLGFVLALSLIAVSASALGILSAGFTIAFKRGESFTRALTTLSLLFGGVLFPVEQFPSWIRWLSQCIPLTYALSAMRKSLLGGGSLLSILPELSILLGFCAVLAPISLWVFRLAVNLARRNGTLVQY